MQTNTYQNTTSNSTKNGITFLIPALNEEESIEFTINLCKKFSEKNPEIPCEILVCDNGSKDKTVSIASEMGCVVIIEIKKGYGSNIINGIKNSKYDYIIFGDADGSYDFSDSRKFYDLLEKDFDLIMGNRFSKNKEYQMEKKSMRILHKYLGNPVLSFIARFMFRVDISDFHCGLRALKKQSFDNGNIFLCKGMEFATEVVAVASKLELKIAEVPVKLFADKRKKASPHLNTWSDGWRHLKFILAMSQSKIFINFGIFFVMLNFLIHLLYLGREFFQINFLTNLSLVTSLFLNGLSYAGLSLIISSIFLSQMTKKNYNASFVKNEKFQNMILKISSDTFFKFSGIFSLIIVYSAYFIFSAWKDSGFLFLDLNSTKLLCHIIIFSQSVPFLLFSITMGFVTYLIKK
jgi:glycosyltransferase involved in cell wall biosynthesis